MLIYDQMIGKENFALWIKKKQDYIGNEWNKECELGAELRNDKKDAMTNEKKMTRLAFAFSGVFDINLPVRGAV